MLSAKPKKCAICRATFSPRNSLQRVCGLGCAITYGNKVSIKKAKQKLDDSDIKVLTKRAQTVFNAYIRLRDAGRPCISCGTSRAISYHAGHYRSVGAMPAMRFNENNCHLQCSRCNTHLSGNLIEFRKGLISRYGVEYVDKLETDPPPLRLRAADLHVIIKAFRDKTVELRIKRKVS